MILNERQKEMYKDCKFLNEGLFGFGSKKNKNYTPNITEIEFNSILDQVIDISEILNKNIKNSRLYKKYYYPYDNKNKKRIYDFKSNITNIKNIFNNKKIINKSDLYIYQTLYNVMENSYSQEVKDFIKENYDEFEEEVTNDIIKIFPKSFKSEELADYIKFSDDKNYPSIEILYDGYNSGEVFKFIIRPKNKYFLKKD